MNKAAFLKDMENLADRSVAEGFDLKELSEVIWETVTFPDEETWESLLTAVKKYGIEITNKEPLPIGYRIEGTFKANVFTFDFFEKPLQVTLNVTGIDGENFLSKYNDMMLFKKRDKFGDIVDCLKCQSKVYSDSNVEDLWKWLNERVEHILFQLDSSKGS
ncbi:hypothetical protein J2S74_002961 [Evansella vedderi]|uniref:Uncharacterized protein n=1 Tax=Evansella vedderi TaxID=38282 RepID=A0ABT9ZXK8_9BACI|nr:hypothetical protein [Evansella vedderi]MDQ0255579.1 hypothetical protein [Evansella vedderi]